MLNKWAVIISAAVLHGCGASAPVSSKSLTRSGADESAKSVVVLSAFEGSRTSKFSGIMDAEVTCSISLLPTESKEFWVFSQAEGGSDCTASQVVLDSHGTMIRFDYVTMTRLIALTGDWASVDVILGVAKSSDIRTMRLSVPSPIVRRARVGESVADVDGKRTSIRKEVTKDGLVLRTENRSSDLPPVTTIEEQYGFIPTGNIWVRDGTYELKVIELEEITLRQEVFHEYRDTIVVAKICEDGAPEECSVQADAALALRETKMARLLVESGCGQANGESCARLGIYQRQGIGGEVDESAALEDLMKGCELGAGVACYAASLSPELAKPAQLVVLEKGCTLGSAQACAIMGRNQARSGDVENGFLAMRDACEKDYLSCDILFESQIEFSEESVRVEGAENLAKLCPTKWQACEKALRFPKLLDSETMEEVAAVERDVTTSACDQGQAHACYRQGTLLLDGVGGEVDTAQGLDLRRKSCELADYLCETRKKD